MRRFATASSLVPVALGVALGLLAGCPDRSISEVNPMQGRVEAKDIPVNINRDLDLLFLIDDSPSMRDKQLNLAANFPRFIDVLSSIPGGLPNVHIGVATSDLGTLGADGTTQPQNVGACSGTGKNGALQTYMVPLGSSGGDKYISDIADPVTGVRTRNYTGDLAAVFGEIATRAGAAGCGFEQHLEAVKRALDPANAVNQGFLRNDAFLGVIFIADEDDCSLQTSGLLTSDETTLGTRQSFRCTRFGITCDQGGQTPDAMKQLGAKTQCHPNDGSAYLTKVNEYATFLKGLKTDPKKVVVAGIMGTTAPFNVEMRQVGGKDDIALAHSCTYDGADLNNDGKPDTQVADPPIRIKFFLDQFPNRSTFSTICQQDLSGGLQQIGDLLKAVIGDPCIEGKLADVDPATDGLQVDCSVSVVNNQGLANQTEQVLPRCTPEDATASNQPCWHLNTDPTACPNSDHFVLKIEGQDTLPKDSHIIANCVTEVTNG